MELNVLRRLLSPDAKIEVTATWAEYEYAQEHLDNEGNKFPRLWYDSASKLATVVAAPTPLHSDVIGELMLIFGCLGRHSFDHHYDVHRHSRWTDDQGMGCRNYRHLMVFCALHCRLGIAMNIIEKDRGEGPSVRSYASEQERNAIIQQARDELRLQLLRHPFGPLEWNNITWFGKLRKVDPNCPPGTLLEPTQSFVIEIVLGDCVPSHLLSGNEM
ncbi:hypothetical protein V1517DRAFT_368438 [Lipomyces orientalis]|uniref:Uncharacterized protein n=1 Tax=Lipomyces orientalis TaxID=1233043 RepID=A0ACC3TKV8_9ASCO